MKGLHLLIGMLLFCFGVQANDIIILKNDKVFEGKIIHLESCSVEFKLERKLYNIPAEDIQSILFEHSTNPILTEYTSRIINEEDNCLKGKMDAKKLSIKLPSYIVLGMIGGPIPLIITKLSNPSPSKSLIVSSASKNEALFDDPAYLECYQKQVRKQFMIAEGVGWAISTALLISLLFNM